MSARAHPIPLIVGALLAGLAAPIVATGAAATTPIDSTVPPTTPIDSTVPPTTDPGGPALELVQDLGDGGQPEDQPREIVIASERFLFDRIVPVDRQELIRVAQEAETIAYARSEGGLFAAIYLSVPDRGEDELARYLPEAIGAPDITCPAEAMPAGLVEAGDERYAVVGFETDLTTASLRQVGDVEEAPIYADPETEAPFPELFVESDEGLLRHLLVGQDGRPASVAASLAFNGTELGFDADATDDVDPTGLTKVGCATAFPVYASAGETLENVTELYVVVGERVLRFAGEPDAEPTDTTAVPATDSTTAATTTTAPSAATTGPTTTATVPATTAVPETTTTTTVPATTTTTTTTIPETTTTTTSTTTTTTTTTTVPTTTTTTTTTVPATTTTVPETTTTVPATTTTIPETTTSTTVPETTAVATEPTAPTAPPTTCGGDPGALDRQGIPNRLPTRIHVDGGVYLFVAVEAIDAVGTLSSVGCIGPFEIVATDQADPAEAIYLRMTGEEDAASQQVYRFEPGLSFRIDVEVASQPQTITAGESSYLLRQVWRPSVYSSTSVILFVPDVEDLTPAIIYARPVSDTVRSDVIGEYRLVDAAAAPPTDVPAAEQAELNPDLTIDGQAYTLVAVHPPIGTTPDGFLTLFGTRNGAATSVTLGLDQRDRELLIFEPDA